MFFCILAAINLIIGLLLTVHNRNRPHHFNKYIASQILLSFSFSMLMILILPDISDIILVVFMCFVFGLVMGSHHVWDLDWGSRPRVPYN